MGSQGVVAVAFVGKLNEPIYFFSEEDTAEGLNLQMIIYGSLDVVEEKRKKISSNTTPNIDPLYLGALYSVDDYKVYGYCSNTDTKVIIVCDYALQENVVKSILSELNGHFIIALQNPFQPIGQPIKSKRFTDKIKIAISKNVASSYQQKRI